MTQMKKVSNWIALFGEKIIQNKERLNNLDTVIGDGDHGSNLTRGAVAVKEKRTDLEYDNLTKLFQDVGMTLISKVGGASGPLYGSAFISMANKAKESEAIGDILAAGLDGVQKRGKADLGEKTMVDVWYPLVKHVQAGTLTFEIIAENLENTKEMKATKGCASYLGDRSIGHLDPGAQSTAYLFEALLETGGLDE